MNTTRRDAIKNLALSAVAVSGATSLASARSAASSAANQTEGAHTTESILRRRIPRTGELIPAIGLGTYRVFNADPDGDLTPLIEVMRIFLSCGGSVIDSSPMYGRSEEVVGRVLKALGRTDLFCATKVWTDGGKQAGIDQMTESMRLMGTDRMDLMQIHNLVDWKTHLPTLRDDKARGVFRYIGITEMRDFDLVERIMREENIDFIQIPYSIDDRRVEERILPVASDTGTAVLVMRPFGAGRLFEVTRNRPLPDFAAEFDCHSWAQFFLKFLLAHDAVTCPIPATSKPHHMLDNMRAGVGRLPDKKMVERMVKELAE